MEQEQEQSSDPAIPFFLFIPLFFPSLSLSLSVLYIATHSLR